MTTAIEPSADGIRRLIADCAPGATDWVVDRLAGGIASATHRITVERDDGEQRQFVLKIYPDGDDTPTLEWHRLTFAARCAVPTPVPIRLDQGGAWFGSPALVMTALPGHILPRPIDIEGFTKKSAAALAAIHQTSVTGITSTLRRPAQWQTWTPPAGIPAGPRLDSVIAAVDELREIAPREHAVLCHDDYHPGNILFQDGELTGVIDWSAARLAPALSDVSYHRAHLAVVFAGDAPERFLSHYRVATGVPLDQLPLWDVLAGAHALRQSPNIAHSVSALGFDLNAAGAARRSETFIDSALRRVRP